MYMQTDLEVDFQFDFEVEIDLAPEVDPPSSFHATFIAILF